MTKKDEIIYCPSCEGTGKQTIEVTTYAKGASKKDPSVKITCIHCQGKGRVLKSEREAYEKAWEEFWCSCGNPSGEVTYYQDDRGHGYDCNDCGKVVQTG